MAVLAKLAVICVLTVLIFYICTQEKVFYFYTCSTFILVLHFLLFSSIFLLFTLFYTFFLLFQFFHFFLFFSIFSTCSIFFFFYFSYFVYIFNFLYFLYFVYHWVFILCVPLPWRAIFHLTLLRGYILPYIPKGKYGMFCVLGNTLVQGGIVEQVNFQYNTINNYILYLYFDQRRDIWWSISWGLGLGQYFTIHPNSIHNIYIINF